MQSSKNPFRIVPAFAKALGCDVSNEKGKKDDNSEKGSVDSQVVAPPLHRVLPRVMVDGPFGSASEDFFKVNFLSERL
jgi:NADPH oxidase 2